MKIALLASLLAVAASAKGPLEKAAYAPQVRYKAKPATGGRAAPQAAATPPPVKILPNPGATNTQGQPGFGWQQPTITRTITRGYATTTQTVTVWVTSTHYASTATTADQYETTTEYTLEETTRWITIPVTVRSTTTVNAGPVETITSTETETVTPTATLTATETVEYPVDTTTVTSEVIETSTDTAYETTDVWETSTITISTSTIITPTESITTTTELPAETVYVTNTIPTTVTTTEFVTATTTVTDIVYPTFSHSTFTHETPLYRY